MREQTRPKHQVVKAPNLSLHMEEMFAPKINGVSRGTGTGRRCSLAIWRQVVSALRSYKVEPRPEHRPECGSNLTFPMENKHLDSLNAHGNFSLSSGLFIRNCFSYMREIGQTVFSHRPCRNSLSQLCERGPQKLWGGFPWHGVPFPTGLSRLSKARSRKGEKEGLSIKELLEL